MEDASRSELLDLPPPDELGGGGGDGPPRFKKGDEDPLGDEIGKIYIRTDVFMVYTTAASARDFGRLRHILFASNKVACQLRETLCPTVGPVTRITDIVCGMRPSFPLSQRQAKAFDSFADRCLAFMAKAMQMAFEGKPERATEMLEGLRLEVESRRDSGNRMRYIFANSFALSVIVGAWLIAHLFGLVEPGILHVFVAQSIGGVPAITYLDVLIFGALGAFFSVSIGLKDIRVNHSITLSEMLYAGFIRVPIGIIAAAVVILLISGGWILTNLDADLRPWTYCLFGFIAGFSELFVPNTLKQVENGTQVKEPGVRVVEG